MSADALDPQGLDQHSFDVPCICPKALARVAHRLLTRNKNSFKRCLWYLQGASPTCVARQRLLPQVGGWSRLRGTSPALFGRSLHPSQGACTCDAPLTHKKLAFP